MARKEHQHRYTVLRRERATQIHHRASEAFQRDRHESPH